MSSVSIPILHATYHKLFSKKFISYYCGSMQIMYVHMHVFTNIEQFDYTICIILAI